MASFLRQSIYLKRLKNMSGKQPKCSSPGNKLSKENFFFISKNSLKTNIISSTLHWNKGMEIKSLLKGGGGGQRRTQDFTLMETLYEI